jgi:2-methylisocitrate lyase-like PEP mutase family enzyme
MDTTLLRERAALLRRLHDRTRILLLPNAWDVASARAVEEAGFPAVATSSAGIAAVLGYADGERIARDEMLEMVARISRALRVPVTADLEAGYL